MARIIKRTWTSRGPTGHKVKRVSYGFTVQLNGKQERRFSATWTDRAAAEDGLKAYLAKRAATQAEPSAPAPPLTTFAEAVERYLAAKARKKAIAHDRRLLRALEQHFGADTPLAEITTAKVSAYRDKELARKSPRGSGEELLAPATVNRLPRGAPRAAPDGASGVGAAAHAAARDP